MSEPPIDHEDTPEPDSDESAADTVTRHSKAHTRVRTRPANVTFRLAANPGRRDVAATTTPLNQTSDTDTQQLHGVVVQFSHSATVFESGNDDPEKENLPALCVTAVSRFEEDFKRMNLKALLEEPSSIHEIFEQPTPRMTSVDHDDWLERQIAITTDDDLLNDPSDPLYRCTSTTDSADPTLANADTHDSQGSIDDAFFETHHPAGDNLFRETGVSRIKEIITPDTGKPGDDPIAAALPEPSTTRTRLARDSRKAASTSTRHRASDAGKPIRTLFSSTPLARSRKRHSLRPDENHPEHITRHKAKTRVTHRIGLPRSSAGTDRHLTVVEYGVTGQGPKAYLHAGLHADELAGVLVLNHLMRRLNAADDRGEIAGHCMIVPVANPIGASQFVQGQMLGRYDLETGENFNRHYPDLVERVADLAVRHLRDDPDYDKLIVRGALRSTLARFKPSRPIDYMRHSLLRLACDADFVLDLHCDSESVMHMYLGTPLWPEAGDLHRQMGSNATLLARSSESSPFDEAIASVWWDLDERLQNHVIEPACLAATIELRGENDVSDDIAARDADNLFKFLQRRGVVTGNPGLLPEPKCNPTPLDGVQIVRAEQPGVITFTRQPGDYIRKNDTVAVIVDPLTTSGKNARTPVVANANGVMFSRSATRVGHPGQVLCKIAGATPISSQKNPRF